MKQVVLPEIARALTQFRAENPDTPPTLIELGVAQWHGVIWELRMPLPLVERYNGRLWGCDVEVLPLTSWLMIW
jgi:hypothetical protein